MFILLLLIFENTVCASGEDPIVEAMKLLKETMENLRSNEELLRHSSMSVDKDRSDLLTVYNEVFEKQLKSLNLVMKMLTSKNNSRCGLNNLNDDDGRLLEVPIPPAGAGLQVSSIVYDCRDTDSSYAVTCSNGDCSTDLWPQCGEVVDHSDENNEDDEDDDIDDNEDDSWQYVECKEISVPYLNKSISCGAGLKKRVVKRLVGQGVFSQEEQLPCQECDQQLFQWSTWYTVGDKMVRQRGSNRILDSYQEEERTVEGTQVLFIGPGRGSGGRSQVLSLPDLTPLECKIPVFPGERYYGYVGRSSSDGVVMCGGVNSVYGGINASCYLLTSSGYQDMPPLTNKRVAAASVVTSLGLWVTGGGGGGSKSLETTELVTNNQSRSHVRLPEGVSHHCLVNINTTHSLLTGGWTGSRSRSSYLYSEDGGFSRIEDMKTPRYDHGCSLINDNTVIVTGGNDGGYTDTETSSEYLNLRTMTWSPGPELPRSVSPAHMVGNILMGGRRVFKLEEEIQAQRKQWRWIERWEMPDTKHHARAFLVDQDMFCKN